jgi:2,4-dienoyl-CoA reductase-like NADH-dependent reductase (Old Yellow Enzyme family)
VQLKLLANYAKPRALRESEILDFIARYARVAAVARETGFTGVQIHSAHGYLLSSFLSPVTNRRTDAWGGALENRARMLIETIRATRKAVGRDFPVALKLNSDDFRKGGFSHAECLQLVRWLNDESLDLLELSGGTYEQPRLLGFSGKAADATPQRESTKQREAYFLDYAAEVRKLATMPLMVTGGFRTRAGVEEALNGGAVDVVGLARPLCGEPDLPKRMLAREVYEMPRYEKQMRLGPGLFAPTTNIFLFKLINLLGQQGWFYLQIFRLADGKTPDATLGVFGAFWRYLLDEYRQAWRVRRAKAN